MYLTWAIKGKLSYIYSFTENFRPVCSSFIIIIRTITILCIYLFVEKYFHVFCIITYCALIRYRTRVILTRGLNIFYPILKGKKVFLTSFFHKILPLCMVSIQERVMMARILYYLLLPIHPLCNGHDWFSNETSTVRYFKLEQGGRIRAEIFHKKWIYVISMLRILFAYICNSNQMRKLRLFRKCMMYVIYFCQLTH